jgi:hypothetical protein
MDLSTCTREELESLIADKGWTLDAIYHAALQDRAVELDGGLVEIGGNDFWFEEQDYLTPSELEQLLDDTFMVVSLMLFFPSTSCKLMLDDIL